MTNIYVMMYKPDDHVLKIKDPIYIPLHCGKDIYKDAGSKEFLPELGDNTGENISKYNNLYSELTGTYWVWKNVNYKPDDIIGINHYRRYFAEPTDLNKPISEKTIKKLLSEHDYLVNGYGTDFDPTQPGDEMIYDQYARMHIKDDMDMAINAIYKIFNPDFAEKLLSTFYCGASMSHEEEMECNKIWKEYDNVRFDVLKKVVHEIKHSGAMCCNNMLICNGYHFDRYCSFIFAVSYYIKNKTDFTQDKYQGYNQRVFGFLSERLMRPFIKAAGYNAIQVPELNWEKYSGYVWE